MKKITGLLLMLLLVSLFVGTVAATTRSGPSWDQKPRVAIVSAFGAELSVLLEEAEINKEVVIDGSTYYVGNLRGVPVVLVLSGVSMVNAASTAADLFTHFNITHAVYSGIAGGVNPNLHIGDVTVPMQWGQYLESYFAREIDGEFVLPPWVTPQFPNFGMLYPNSTCVTEPQGEPDRCIKKFWFEVDAEMLAVAEESASSVVLAQCTSSGVCLDFEPQIILGGNGVSGQTFVDNAEFREYTWETFQADALDMETSAFAHVAFEKGVPYIAFRSLSDLAGGGNGENQIGIFFRVAADNSAAVVLGFLEEWAD